MRKKLLFFIFLLYCSLLSFAQEAPIDSLLNLLKTSMADTTKVNVLNNLFLQYEFEDVEKAEKYLKEALELAEKSNYQKGLATAYVYSGYFEEDKSNYSSALTNYEIALAIYSKIGDKIGTAQAYNSIGNIYERQGKYPEALKFFLSSLKLYLEAGNKKGEASAYANMGLVYVNQNNFSDALKNDIASLKIYEAMGDKNGQAIANLNIGNVYATQNNFKEALKYFLVSLKISEEVGNKINIANLTANIGLIYQLDGNYNEAIKSYKKSLSFYEEVGSKSGIAVCYGNMGEALIGQKNYSEARKYLNKGIDLARQIGDKECLKNAYIAFTQMDSITGNYRGAYENHKKYILYRDSLNNEETRNMTIQNQMTFDFEKKEAIATAEHKKELENQQSLSEERNRKQKTIITFVIAGLLLVLIFSGFVFRSLQTTRKQKNIIEEQKNIVELQKKQVEEQKILVEEKQSAIIDSIFYARRIQQSLLPTESYIEKTLKRLMKK